MIIYPNILEARKALSEYLKIKEDAQVRLGVEDEPCDSYAGMDISVKYYDTLGEIQRLDSSEV